ncbi:M64 family metallopeptidase [Sphingobacterium bovistauri]|uniref:Ig-like domain-containing protein n=1 Tax=Sphingobacterium bovistauri TaxID=2781959 RepID=A0ABS7Z3F6_9SPHI|nr:M64 family metallopeptidase [Sphingobacterium bovistauri]MCA5004518.1 hypothetical protein [Sphingobacterium bovistauri]
MMKYLIATLISFLIALHGSAQSFKIDSLQYQGSSENIVNLVILGDGYTADEIVYFQEDAKRFTEYFFKTEPFSQYINYFNVFAINTISEESGATHTCTASDCPKVHHNEENLHPRFNQFPTRIAVPEISPNTIFGSSFDNAGIHRLVVPQKGDKIEEVLENHIPNYTQVVILVNSPYYGGSGGKYATATVNFKSNEIAVHEIGHSFAHLGDEYWAGNQYATEGPNRTQEADPKKVSWSHWIGTNGIGVYSYGAKDSRAKWFRPHEFCKMQYLVAPFCSVCQEVFVQTIHNKSNPITRVFPKADQIVDVKDANKFGVNILKPSPNTMRVRWYLNGKILTHNQDSIYLNKGILQKGINTLKVEVKDTTLLVRNPNHQPDGFSKTWQINAEKDFELDPVVSTWGDTLETCFNGYQALTVKNPQSGIIYKWYESEKSRKPIATGSNWVTPRLKKDNTYFVSAHYKKKSSVKKPIHIKLLAEIERPTDINVALSNGKYKITVNQDLLKKYKLIWDIGGKKSPLRGQSRAEIEIPMDEAPNSIYLELIDKVSTCKSDSFEIKLK